MRTLSEIAEEVQRCGFAWEPEALLIGNVRADEVAHLAGHVFEQAATITALCESQESLAAEVRRLREENAALEAQNEHLIGEYEGVCKGLDAEVRRLRARVLELDKPAPCAVCAGCGDADSTLDEYGGDIYESGVMLCMGCSDGFGMPLRWEKTREP